MNILEKKIFYVAVILLTSIEIYSFTVIPNNVFDVAKIIVLIAILSYLLFGKNHPEYIPIKKNFSYDLNMIIFSVLLSSVPALHYHNQPIEISLLASRLIFYWLFYLFLHKLKPDPLRLEALLKVMGIIWAIITVVQQFTYPHILFSTRDISDKFFDYSSETRGVLRINIAGIWFGFFSLITIINKLKIRLKWTNLFWLVLLGMGVVFLGARQYLTAIILIFILSLCFSFVNEKYSSRYRLLLITLPIMFWMFNNYTFINTLIMLTKNELLEPQDYIRLLSINYYLFNYWPDWICVLIGNGWEHSFSTYGQEIYGIWDSYHYYREDIGIIGALNKFGLFYIIVISTLLYKVFFKVKVHPNKRYIKLIFILLFFLLFTAQDWFSNEYSILFLAIIFYLIDRYSIKNVAYRLLFYKNVANVKS